MRFVVTTAVALVLFCLNDAQAQDETCKRTDFDCIAARTITKVVNSYAGKSGVLDFALGSFCSNKELMVRGKASHEAVINEIIQKADVNVRTDLSAAGADIATYTRIQGSIPTAVRLARVSETSGVIAGLKSAFSSYPRTKLEYCSVMVPALLAKKS